MNLNFPKQRHKVPVSELAKRYGKSITAMENLIKAAGLSKTREQYEQDAQIRRETAYKLREKGLKYREIAEMLGITTNNAQQLVRRYQQTA